MEQKIYITSPIYYVNDVPHIGHAYTTFLSDMLKKFYTLEGKDVLFTTGTDEHGQKIEQSAQKHALSPKAYADKISLRFRELWNEFSIDYDIFVRTTDESHCLSVQRAFEIMYAKGDIYKGSYEGHYCISCESFFTKTQLGANESCPDCGKITQLVQEESYFFALSKYEKPILEYLKSHPKMIAPAFYQDEIINFVQNGLNDLSITRTSFEWGVSLPENPTRDDSKKHVMYVWLDALLSYLSPLGYLDNEAKMPYWEGAIHFVGKDILRFHAIYWLGFLMSLSLPLPKHIYTHGWWTRDGAKMSKSIGNVVNPKEMADIYGVEPLRYFLLREMPFGQDGDFSETSLIERINTELGNDLGNLLNRLYGMSEKYFDLSIDSTDVRAYFENELEQLHTYIHNALEKMHLMQPHRFIEELWKIFSLGNHAISKYEPWNLIKEHKNTQAMALLALIANILAKGSILLYPIMPKNAAKIACSLGLDINAKSFESYITKHQLLPLITLEKIPPLFPRLESKPKQQQTHKEKEEVRENLLDIKDFHKLDICIGTIVECQAIEKSQKLLKLLVDIGENKPRQIISGIAQHYTPKDLIHKQVCLIINLKPAKLMGQISEGMILASSDENGLSLLSVDKARKNGSKIS